MSILNGHSNGTIDYDSLIEKKKEAFYELEYWKSVFDRHVELQSKNGEDNFSFRLTKSELSQRVVEATDAYDSIWCEQLEYEQNANDFATDQIKKKQVVSWGRAVVVQNYLEHDGRFE